MSKDSAKIEEAISDLRNKKKAKNRYNIDDQGKMTDYLGINFGTNDQGRLKLWQPHFIDQIVEETHSSCKYKASTTS